MKPSRVVSLIASATEIVCALGFEKSLVGRSHECDYPPSVTKLPALTAPKIDASAPSAEIDRQVRDLAQDALSVYKVDSAELERLKPDVIVTQAQCEVCAVSLKDVERAVAERAGIKAKVVSLTPNSLADVWADIRRVGDALGAAHKASELVARLSRRMDETASRARLLSPKPAVACLEWVEPLMACGNWMPELVEMAGGVEAFGRPGRHSPTIAWEDLRAKDPDVLFIAPCGFDLARTEAELSALKRLPGFSDLKAARTGRVYLADGNQYFNRPGPRLVESLEILAEALHPDRFRFGFENRAYKRASAITS